jgi:50S ribosomal subunit-associated GTPase HflX
MDRRIILQRITLLKQRLEEIDKQKTTQRKNRGQMIRVALVGYTNVGKSTIMNMLAKITACISFTLRYFANRWMSFLFSLKNFGSNRQSFER